MKKEGKNMKKQLIAVAILLAIAASINAMQGQKSIAYNDTYQFDVYKYLTAQDLNDLKQAKSFILTNVDKFAKPGSPQELRDANGNVWAKKTGAFFRGTSNRGYETWNIIATPAISAGRTPAVAPRETAAPNRVLQTTEITFTPGSAPLIAKTEKVPAVQPQKTTSVTVIPQKAKLESVQSAAPRILQQPEITMAPTATQLIAQRGIVPVVQPQKATQVTLSPAIELRATKETVPAQVFETEETMIQLKKKPELKPVEITMVPTASIAKREIVPAVQPQKAVQDIYEEVQAIKETVPAQVFEKEETTLQLEPKLAQPAQESPFKGLAQKLAAGMKSTFQQTPAFQAAYYNAINQGDTKALSSLLARRANPNIVLDQNNNKRNPLEIALESNIPEDKKIAILDALIDAGADKQILNKFLANSARTGQVKIVKWLLDHGATENLNDALRETEEMLAKNPQSIQFKTILELIYEKKI